MVKSMEDLESKEQRWLINATVSIILANGNIEQDQVAFLKKLCAVFLEEESRKTLEKVSGTLKNKKMPKIAKIHVKEIENLIFMLDILSASVFANGKKAHEETTKYFEAGKNLGVSIGTLSYRLSLEAEKCCVKRKLSQIKDEMRKNFYDHLSLKPER